jgi:NTE family protein
VAEAVAASAAYPLFLPAFHRRYRFKKNGITCTKEIILTDGGVYDNLGTTCLEPGRNPEYTDHVYDHNSVIACHAGMGQWPKNGRPYGWMSRVSNAMKTTFRKNEDAQKGQVLSWGAVSDSPLQHAILTSLGQKDEILRRDLSDKVPDNLVPREAVVHYPTDFNPMPKEDLERIVLRGKQVTRLLLDAYWH